jgi:DNA-binding XRE family transcriptional regulator
MKALEKIQNDINAVLPNLEMSYDPAETDSGSSWLDIETGEQHLTIEYKPDQGFGLYTGNNDSFGSGPNEVYRKETALLKRIAMLLLEQRLPITMKEIRELAGKTQKDLSTLMGQRQSSISKLENRTDVQLSSIESFITALGGKLVIKAHFDDFDLPVSLVE